MVLLDIDLDRSEAIMTAQDTGSLSQPGGLRPTSTARVVSVLRRFGQSHGGARTGLGETSAVMGWKAPTVARDTKEKER
jgi:hypothetical protein